MVNDRPEDIAAFLERYGSAGPAVLDPDGAAYVDFGVVKVPETYVIDPDGIVAAKVNGSVTADGLDAIVGRLAEARAGGAG